jgi:hypothetical protein
VLDDDSVRFGLCNGSGAMLVDVNSIGVFVKNVDGLRTVCLFNGMLINVFVGFLRCMDQ